MNLNRWKSLKEKEDIERIKDSRIGKIVSMAEMRAGECGRVIELQAEQTIKQRFKALGLEEGAEITCLFSSFQNDPSAFEICGCTIALRKKDRKGVKVRILSKRAQISQESQIVCAEATGENEVCTIALAGNPNVGKSTLFNELTGLHQHTGNWTGKTVELAMGSRTAENIRYEFLDLPGTYSLQSHSEEERVAEECLRGDCYDVAVVVCDATCLKRNLLLALEILEVTKKVVLCVNLLDEAEKKLIQIDLKTLSQRLGIPVVGCAARSGRGIEELLEQCLEMKRTNGKRKDHVQDIQEKGQMELTKNRYIKADSIVKEVVKYANPTYQNKEQKLDKFLTSKRTGIPIMLLLLFVVFWLTMKGANRPSELLSEGFAILGIKLRLLLNQAHAPTFLIGILMDGVYQVTSFVISVMLPPMAIFFPLFTILEDYGYLPRVAFNLDHTFQKCRACGKQALTMTIDLVNL